MYFCSVFRMRPISNAFKGIYFGSNCQISGVLLIRVCLFVLQCILMRRAENPTANSQAVLTGGAVLQVDYVIFML